MVPGPVRVRVTVAITYTVPAGAQEAFLAAAARVRDSRRRTGAVSWNLERSAESADRFREQFRVRSWSEFTASRTERWTGSDAEALATLVDAATDVQEEHYFPAPVTRAGRAATSV